MIVIPCYNEEKRLPTKDIMDLALLTNVAVTLVNDGSSDGTFELLKSIERAAPHKNIQLISFSKNSGKGQAVRAGIASGIEQNFELIGYIDADMAVPVSEVSRIISIAQKSKIKATLGARVALLGHTIKRKPARHYLGRVFATFASLILKAQVYDTQCGAKFFQNNDALVQAIRKPFKSRWAFDVELIGRLLSKKNSPQALTLSDFLEVPLLYWEDKAGSTLGFSAMAKAAFDLTVIWRDLKNG